MIDVKFNFFGKTLKTTALYVDIYNKPCDDDDVCCAVGKNVFDKFENQYSPSRNRKTFKRLRITKPHTIMLILHYTHIYAA